MKLEVLISCMHQQDGLDLIHRSRLTGNVLMINQTDQDKEFEFQENGRRLHIINTTQRGLSNSRNMAIERADGDICLLCDDDEEFLENYESTIIYAFRALPQADIIAFNVDGKLTRLSAKTQKLGFMGCLKLASYQIAFRRKSIVKNKLVFDVFMGAGSGNGCGEENNFLWDCLKAGLKIYYVPKTIAAIQPNDSTWFFGYNQDFFYQRGAATRHMMGLWLSIFYGIYYLMSKIRLYGSAISPICAGRALFRGIFDNPIRRQIQETKD